MKTHKTLWILFFYCCIIAFTAYLILRTLNMPQPFLISLCVALVFGVHFSVLLVAYKYLRGTKEYEEILEEEAAPEEAKWYRPKNRVIRGLMYCAGVLLLLCFAVMAINAIANLPGLQDSPHRFLISFCVVLVFASHAYIYNAVRSFVVPKKERMEQFAEELKFSYLPFYIEVAVVGFISNRIANSINHPNETLLSLTILAVVVLHTHPFFEMCKYIFRKEEEEEVYIEKQY